MKKKTSPVSLLLALCLLAPALAQPSQQPRPASPAGQPQQRPSAPPDSQDDVVRITTNLVQVDAVVTDKEGRQVTDLTPEDFEVLEEGKAQKITNFAYVPVGAPGTRAEDGSGTTTAAATPPTPRRAPAPPTPPVRRERVRRTIALVVDNLRMSHQSIGSVRDGLRKFVNEQVQPGDLVGIFRTRGGSGALQQFTADKAQMHRAIDALRWYPRPLGRTGIDVFDPARSDSANKTTRAGSTEGPRGQPNFEDDRTRETREAEEERLEDINQTGSLGALRLVLSSMERAPGRRLAVLFGDGYGVIERDGTAASRSLRAMTNVIDTANRAGVVVYTLDARGVFAARFISAADDVRPEIPSSLMGSAEEPSEELSTERYKDYIRSQDGYAMLADATGGRFLKNANDIDKLLARVVRDQSGYYLLGYRPSEETFKAGREHFRDIKVRVKRPGLSVRSRKGFLAFADEPARRTRVGATDSGLYSMLAAPITASDVDVRMTAGVVGAGAQGTANAARLLLHIDARDVTFTDEPNGWKKLVLDVAAVTLDKDGEVVDEFTRTHTVRTAGDTLQRIQENGLTYTADVPVKRPGSYQMRIVVRDQATQKVGSASQFIDVPDFSKGRLTMSAVSLREGAAAQQPSAAAGQGAPATAATALAPVMSAADPAVRRFRPGAVLAYGYQVYNAALDPATGRPRLTAQLRLFHNGELAAEGQPTTLDTAGQTDAARPRFEELMRVVENARPGEYVLQVVVTDTLAKGGAQTSQWIDFEVVR